MTPKELLNIVEETLQSATVNQHEVGGMTGGAIAGWYLELGNEYISIKLYYDSTYKYITYIYYSTFILPHRLYRKDFPKEDIIKIDKLVDKYIDYWYDTKSDNEKSKRLNKLRKVKIE